MSYNTKNYQAQDGDTWVVGQDLFVTGQITTESITFSGNGETLNSTDVASIKALIDDDSSGIGLVGDGVTNNAGVLSTWITSVGSAESSLTLTKGTYMLSANVTVPSNINLVFEHGAKFKGSIGTETLTINGGIEASCNSWIFENIVVIGSINVDSIYPEWFTSLNTTDYSDAFERAFSLASLCFSKVVLTQSQYNISRTVIINDKTSIHVNKKAGKGGTVVIRPNAGFVGNYLFDIRNLEVLVSGIAFDCIDKTISGVLLFKETFSGEIVPHRSVLEKCSFLNCLIGVAVNWSCGIVIEKSRFISCYIGVQVDKNANILCLENCVFFSFEKSTSLACIYVIQADLVKATSCWSELSEVPFITGQDFSNICIEKCWIEHTGVNDNPLITTSTVVSGSNLTILNTELISSHQVIINVDLNSMYLENVRVAGINSVFPIIELNNTNYTKLVGIHHSYTNNPENITDSIIVNGGLFVEREGFIENVVESNYVNNFSDSSFKDSINLNLVASAGVTLTHINTSGMFDNNSIMTTWTSVNSNVRSFNSIALLVGDYVRLSCYMKTDSTSPKYIKLAISGATAGQSKTVSLTNNFKRFDIIWKVPASANGSYYFYLFNLSLTGFNVLVDDIQISKSTNPIPRLPYIMNNSTRGSGITSQIRQGFNISEHYLAGQRISVGSAIPTFGSYWKGDKIYNDLTVSTIYTGWVCIVGGIPGTWKGFGLIEA